MVVDGVERTTKEAVPAVEFLEVILDVNKRECEIMGLTAEVGMHFHMEGKKEDEEKPANVTEARVTDYFRKKAAAESKIVDVETTPNVVPAIAPPVPG